MIVKGLLHNWQAFSLCIVPTHLIQSFKNAGTIKPPINGYES